MTINGLIQGGVVALLVLWAGWTAFGRLTPRARARVLRALADRLQAPGRPGWMLRLALRLRPPPDAASGCNAGCDSCDSCGSAAKGAEQPIKPRV